MTSEPDGTSSEEFISPGGERGAGSEAKQATENLTEKLDTPLGYDIDEWERYEGEVRNIWFETVGIRPDLNVHGAAISFVESTLHGAGFFADIRRQAGGRRGPEPAGSPSDPTPSPTPVPTAAIDGDVGTVNLLVAAEVRALTPAQVPVFVRRRLAPTVARLHRNNATREEVSDIVVHALRPLAGRPEASDLARRLIGYLMRDPVREPGFYLTIDTIGDVLIQDPDAKVHGVIAYHLVVRGMREFFMAGGTFDSTSRSLPSLTLASIANEINKLGDPPPRDAIGVALGLLHMSAVVAEDRRIDPDVAIATLRNLGLPEEEPVETVTVLHAITRISGLELVDLDRAVADAYSGSVAALCGDPELVAMKLFNAGVSLIRARLGTPEGLRARLVLNLAGLQWGLLTSEDLQQLEDTGGYSCAVNFVGAASELRREDQSGPLWTALAGTVHSVIGLAAVLNRPELNSQNARLEASARQMGFSIKDSPDPATLLSSMHDALTALTLDAPGPPDWSHERPQEQRSVTLAGVVGWVLRDLLQLSNDRIAQTLHQLVGERHDARQVLIDGYAPFLDGEGPVGDGPWLAAGLIGEAEWRARVSATLGPVEPTMLENDLLTFDIG